MKGMIGCEVVFGLMRLSLFSYLGDGQGVCSRLDDFDDGRF
jgi:hypothetical protein